MAQGLFLSAIGDYGLWSLLFVCRDGDVLPRS